MCGQFGLPAGSAFNLTWSPAERIVCSDAEIICAQMIASQRAFGRPPVGGKEDLKKAFHQVGRRRDQVRIVQLFWHPDDRRVVGREQIAQDFGGSGAVTNCNVVYRALRDIASRWLYINADNYVDDYCWWEPEWSASSAQFALCKICSILGYDFHEGKRRMGMRIPLVGLFFESTNAGPVVTN